MNIVIGICTTGRAMGIGNSVRREVTLVDSNKESCFLLRFIDSAQLKLKTQGWVGCIGKKRRCTFRG